MHYIQVKTDDNDVAMDIPSMFKVDDADFDKYVREHLFFFDHHEVLRSNFGQYPIATTPQQIDILIEYFQELRTRMITARG